MKNASFDPSEDFWLSLEDGDETNLEIPVPPSPPYPDTQFPPDENYQFLLPIDLI